jgi:exosome complex RNA-binding protein Rrp4
MEYKLWEVIKMLTENPKLEFKDEYGHIIFVKENGWIYIRHTDGSKMTGEELDTDLFRKSINVIYRIYEEPRKEESTNIIINVSVNSSDISKVAEEIEKALKNIKLNLC